MRTFLAFLVLLFTPQLVTAQETELPEEARYRLDYLVGTWDVYDDVLDEDGNVVETTHSINITEWFLGDAVLQTTIIPDEGQLSKTIRFYDKEKEIFYEIFVGKEGNLFILSGGLDEYVVTYTSRRLRDGIYPIVRIYHVNIEPNSFDAVQEVSFDEGETWQKVNRNQRLVRRTNLE